MHDFLAHLNSLSQHIKFTIKIEKDGKIPFLDVLLTKKEEGGLGYQVYRKDTHRDKYLHANYHHHPAQNVGIIKTLATIEKQISDADHINNELDHLGMVFRKNGYRNKQINEAINEHNHRKKYFKIPMITLPYIKGTTDNLTKILKKRGIIVAFSPPNSIRKFVDSALDQRQQKGVYEIPCLCGKV